MEWILLILEHKARGSHRSSLHLLYKGYLETVILDHDVYTVTSAKLIIILHFIRRQEHASVDGDEQLVREGLLLQISFYFLHPLLVTLYLPAISLSSCSLTNTLL